MKTNDSLKATILIVNTAFLSEKGSVQAYACRERAADAKTVKVAPAMVKGRILMAGDVLYVSDGIAEGDTNSNYRTLRSGTVAFELPGAEDHTPQGEDTSTADTTDVPF